MTLDEFIGLTDSERETVLGPRLAATIDRAVEILRAAQALEEQTAPYLRLQRAVELVTFLKQNGARVVHPPQDAGEVARLLRKELELASAAFPEPLPADIKAMKDIHSELKTISTTLQNKPAAIVLKKDKGQTSAVAVVNKDGTAQEVPVLRK